MLGRLLLIGLVLTSCAQVGSLEGGVVDRTAPKPKLNKMEPANGTTFFQGNEIVIPFDEYISLNNPQANLVVVPPNIRPKVSKKGRVVSISWDDTLLPNTTYSFYFNNLIQDITEKNDSIMQFVVSTGSYIDSLSATFRVIDAQTAQPLEKITVALYSKFNDTIKPVYFAQTNKQGIAKLSYLKGGEYAAVAFQDNNKDLLLQKNEWRGFLKSKISPVYADSNITTINVFPPKKDPGISSFTHIPPRAFRIGFNELDSGAVLYLNKKLVDSSQYTWINADSLHLVYEGPDTSQFQLIVEASSFSDTAKLRIKKSDFQLKPSLEPIQKKKVKSTEAWTFLATAPIQKVNADSISFFNGVDTVESSFNWIKNLSSITVMPSKGDKVEKQNVVFNSSGIIFSAGQEQDSLSFRREVISPESLGTLFVNCSSDQTGNILHVVQNRDIVLRKVIPSSGKIKLDNLPAGDYSFEIIVDSNGDGKWTTGDLELGVQPEEIYRFPKTNKLRPSWELEVDLLPSENE